MHLMLAAYYDIMIFSKICSKGGDLPKQHRDRLVVSGRDARSAGRSQAILTARRHMSEARMSPRWPPFGK